MKNNKLELRLIVEVLRLIHSELKEIKQSTTPVSYSTFQTTTFSSMVHSKIEGNKVTSKE